MSLSCAICFDNLFAGDESIYSTKCGHIFHHNCLLQRLKSFSTCPNCRENVTIDSLLKLNAYVGIERSTNYFSKNRSIARNVWKIIQRNLLQSELMFKNLELKLEVTELLKNIQLRRMEKIYKLIEKDNETLKLKNTELQKENERLKNMLHYEKERNTIFRSDLRIMDIIDLDQETSVDSD